VAPPGPVSRDFKDQLKRCDTALTKQGIEAPDEIKLHDLRHTHATVLLRAGEHPKVVSERLGHTSVVNCRRLDARARVLSFGSRVLVVSDQAVFSSDVACAEIFAHGLPLQPVTGWQIVATIVTR
jgi:hypothetical protein